MKPHKVRYYPERRDLEFAEKTADVLCVYRKVKLLKKNAAATKTKPSDAVTIISYDEKPGIQAIAMTAPDLAPEPGVHATLGTRSRIQTRRHGHLAGRHRPADQHGSRLGQGSPPQPRTGAAAHADRG